MSRYYDRTADELRDIDLHEGRVTYPEAATLVGLPEPTVRQWRSRRHLQPVEIDDDGRLRFRPIDVLRAEAEAAAVKQGRPRTRQAPPLSPHQATAPA